MSSSSSFTVEGLAEKGETRVMGLGIGVFLIFFFLLVSVVVCLAGATTPRPGAFACGGTGLLSLVLILLIIAEKDSRFVEDKSDQLQEFDQAFYPRVLLVLLLAVAALMGFGGICAMHIGKPIYAIPLYDHRTEARKPLF